MYSFTPRKELDLSVFEALTLMIAFATLVVLILGFEQKK
ncbi:putative holin-like toxin [Listeria grayi]